MSRCQQAGVPSGASRGESFPCLFQLLEAARAPWLVANFHCQRGESHIFKSLRLTLTCRWLELRSRILITAHLFLFNLTT